MSYVHGSPVDLCASPAEPLQLADPATLAGAMKTEVMDWYKDAVVYEVPVRAFQDANNDGSGDLLGILHRLDYIASLGVTAIWLLPFYPSPLKDEGYDISDYRSVHADYGSLEDLKKLIDAVHQRGMRIITELVVNHTSDQHPWFQRARRAPAGSPDRDYYVWNDDPEKYQDARIIFTDTEDSNWTWDPVAGAYYWHRFFSHQPDLNYDNPAIESAVLDIVDYWLDMGIDGLRLDAVPYLVEREGTNCENLPETHAILKRLRAYVDRKYPGRLLLAEANQWPEDAVAYFGDGDESHMNYHFPLMPRLYLGVTQSDRTPILEILERTPPIPPTAQWGVFLRNHDELTLEMVNDDERRLLLDAFAQDERAPLNVGIRRRLAPLLDGDHRKLSLMFSLLFSLPGTPFLYYGDEIGMGDNLDLPDRDGLRTPMQWDASPNAGFSKSSPESLYRAVNADNDFGFARINVADQEKDPDSLLNTVRWLIKVRRRHSAFGRGRATWLAPSDKAILAFTLEHGEEFLFVAANMADRAVEIDLPSGVNLLDGTWVHGRTLIEGYGFRWVSRV